LQQNLPFPDSCGAAKRFLPEALSVALRVVSGASGPARRSRVGTVNALSGGKFSFADVNGGGQLNVSKSDTAHDLHVSRVAR
jgi:hypothetical protein